METQKEKLAKSFYNFLLYDQIGRLEWVKPFSDNSAQHERIKKDAERMAELAIKELVK